MKKLAALPIFLFLALSNVKAQTFTVSTDTNGVLKVVTEGRSTNFFDANMLFLLRSLSNNANARIYIVDYSTNNPDVFIPRKSATNWFGKNWTFDGLTATNFSSPGSGSFSIKVGAAATASGTFSVGLGYSGIATSNGAIAINSISSEVGSLSFGDGDTVASGVNSVAFPSSATASGINSMAIGYFSDSSFDNSVALGASAAATAVNQIRLGTADEHVSIPGRLESASGFITSIVDSNTLYGTLELKAGSVSTLVNGNNAGIILSTNSLVELSGGTTISQIAGFAASRDGDTRLLRFTGAITNIVVNEANSIYSTDPTSVNRIVTGTGGDFYMTNQPAWMKVRYRAASSRWEVLDKSN